MKYIVFIVLDLVLLAAIGGIVLWASMPTAKLTVRAVRPMGTNILWGPTNWVSGSWPTNEQSWPVWEVAITNNGRAPAHWFPRLVMNAGGTVFLHDAERPSDPHEGVLRPGQHTNVYMPVPPDSTTVWAAGVEYLTPQSGLEKRLSSSCKPGPLLRQLLLPNEYSHWTYDAWHSGTNVTTAE